MSLSDLLKKENIVLNLESTEKEELFSEMVEVLVRNDSTLDRNAILGALINREEQINTCVKNGIAIPHAFVPGLNKTMCVLGISRLGIDYDLEDVSFISEKLVHIVVMLLHDSKQTSEHLKLLVELAYDFKSDEFYKNLLRAQNVDEVLNFVREREFQ